MRIVPSVKAWVSKRVLLKKRLIRAVLLATVLIGVFLFWQYQNKTQTIRTSTATGRLPEMNKSATEAALRAARTKPVQEYHGGALPDTLRGSQ